SSILDLLRRLVDTDLNRNDLAGPAGAGPAQGRRAQSIEPDGDSHVGFRGTEPVGGIEGDPTELRQEGFRPGVAALLLAGAFVVDVAADIARRDAQTTRGGDEDVREVLHRAAFAHERLGGRECATAGS